MSKVCEIGNIHIARLLPLSTPHQLYYLKQNG